jgi:hypothetical protein
MTAYIDDEILAGKRYAIDDVKRGLREHVTISGLVPLRRHLGVHYTKGEDAEGSYYETKMRDYVYDTVTIYEEVTGKASDGVSQSGISIHRPRRTTAIL